jgi:hypothetical protein
MSPKRSLIIFLLIASLSQQAMAQSADAGIATTENQIRDRWRHSVMLTYMYGSGGSSSDSTSRDLTYKSLLLSGEVSIFGGTSIWAALPLNQQDGPLGSVSGIGDLMLIVNQKLFGISSVEVSLGMGARFATATVNEDSLPQSYQSGLGSTDILIEGDVISKNINLGMGYQLAGKRSINSITRLKRGDELLFRGGYTYRGDLFDIGGEFIAIKPLQESSVLNPLSQGAEFVNIPESNDFQVDLLLKARYHFSELFGLTGTISVPLSKRNTNVDGLTRVFAASFGLSLDL